MGKIPHQLDASPRKAWSQAPTMNNVATSMVIIPGVVALLLFLVFTYLYEQSRQQYFRAWQLGWGAYTLHFALDAWAIFGTVSYSQCFFWPRQALLVAMGLCIFVSTRLMRERFASAGTTRRFVSLRAGTGLVEPAPHAPERRVPHEIVSAQLCCAWRPGCRFYCLLSSFDFYQIRDSASHSVAFGLLGTSA